jgi:hypothetical protein
VAFLAEGGPAMIEVAFTVRAPWSAMIAEAEALQVFGVRPKLVENRGRPVAPKHFGTRVGIHAGVAWSAEGEHDPRVRYAWTQFAKAFDPVVANPRLAGHGDRRTGFPNSLLRIHRTNSLWIPRAAVVATAAIAGCHLAGACVVGPCHPWGDLTYNGKPAWHIELVDVRRLPEPVPARGQLGVPWRLPEDVAAAVQAQLDAALLSEVRRSATVWDPPSAGLADRCADIATREDGQR